jgi:rhodanese-related sulfurtransferase
MKAKMMLTFVLAAAIAATGCRTTHRAHESAEGKCAACGAKTEKKCSHCGMPKGHCKGATKAAPMAEINTAALKTLIDSGASLTLVDARTGKYDDGRRIGKAISLSPEATDAEIGSALPAKDAMIVTYCVNTKCPASRLLATRLTTLGYKHVLEYPQGIEGWAGDGNAVTAAAK